MKKIFLILVVLFLFAGCSSYQSSANESPNSNTELSQEVATQKMLSSKEETKETEAVVSNGSHHLTLPLPDDYFDKLPNVPLEYYSDLNVEFPLNEGWKKALKELAAGLDLTDYAVANVYAKAIIGELKEYFPVRYFESRGTIWINKWTIYGIERFDGGWCVSLGEGCDIFSGVDIQTGEAVNDEQLALAMGTMLINDYCFLILFADDGHIINILRDNYTSCKPVETYTGSRYN